MHLHFFVPSDCKTFTYKTQASELLNEPTFVGEPSPRRTASVWVSSLRKSVVVHESQKRETKHPQLLVPQHLYVQLALTLNKDLMSLTF